MISIQTYLDLSGRFYDILNVSLASKHHFYSISLCFGKPMFKHPLKKLKFKYKKVQEKTISLRWLLGPFSMNIYSFEVIERRRTSFLLFSTKKTINKIQNPLPFPTLSLQSNEHPQNHVTGARGIRRTFPNPSSRLAYLHHRIFDVTYISINELIRACIIFYY
jgi:hypothetical protein